MKKIRIVLLFVLLSCGVSAYAWRPAPRTYPNRPRRCVKVPLDGGLLAILGAAGITYYLVRRKDRKKEQ